MSDRRELLALIREQAILRGNFELRAGAVSDTYVDLRRVTQHGRGAPLVGRVMLKLVEPLQFGVVGGPTMGADPIAAAMLHTAAARGGQLDMCAVRKTAKTHGLRQQVEGPDIAGRRVLAVEDTTTTGASVLEAVQVLQGAGAQVIGVAVILERDTAAREAVEQTGLPFLAAFTWHDLGLD